MYATCALLVNSHDETVIGLHVGSGMQLWMHRSSDLNIWDDPVTGTLAQGQGQDLALQVRLAMSSQHVI